VRQILQICAVLLKPLGIPQEERKTPLHFLCGAVSVLTTVKSTPASAQALLGSREALKAHLAGI